MTGHALAGSLCTGIMGLDLAVAEVFGSELAWYSEIEPGPCRIIDREHPGVPNLGDLTKVDWDLLWYDGVMGAPRNDDQADAMYARYTEGLSLAQVATEFGCTRQSVYVIFKRRGWELHQRPPGRLFQVYKGVRYSLRNNGYYGATTGNRLYLHRVMWGDVHGPVPTGHDIHHKDHDKTNNVIENLECIPKADHTRHHQFHKDQGEEVVPTDDSPPVDILTAGYP